MRLLYFVQYFPPEKASGLPLITDMIKGFADYGWNIDVYVPTPTRGITDDVRKEYKKKRKEVHCNGKLIIHRMRLYRESNNMMQRMIRYSIFSFQCLLRSVFITADAIFTGGGPPTQGIVGGLVHKWTKKKFIFNPQDLFPDSLVIAGQADENSRIVKAGRKLEKYAYNNADVIITITDDMAQNIMEKTDDKSKVHVVRNWVDTEKIIPIEKSQNKMFGDLHIPQDKFNIVYAGNIGMMQGIDTIIEAAEKLKDEEQIQFIIIGNGSEEEHIQQMIQKKQMANVLMFPLQDEERVSEVYSLADISIIPCKAGTGSAGMPSKTWTIMATGRAILGSFDVGSEMDNILHDANCGYCIGAGNANKLAEEIIKLYRNPQTVKCMGENARKYTEENISKDRAIRQYIKIIENTIRQR